MLGEKTCKYTVNPKQNRAFLSATLFPFPVHDSDDGQPWLILIKSKFSLFDWKMDDPDTYFCICHVPHSFGMLFLSHCTATDEPGSCPLVFFFEQCNLGTTYFLPYPTYRKNKTKCPGNRTKALRCPSQSIRLNNTKLGRVVHKRGHFYCLWRLFITLTVSNELHITGHLDWPCRFVVPRVFSAGWDQLNLVRRFFCRCLSPVMLYANTHARRCCTVFFYLLFPRGLFGVEISHFLSRIRFRYFLFSYLSSYTD